MAENTSNEENVVRGFDLGLVAETNFDDIEDTLGDRLTEDIEQALKKGGPVTLRFDRVTYESPALLNKLTKAIKTRWPGIEVTSKEKFHFPTLKQTSAKKKKRVTDESSAAKPVEAAIKGFSETQRVNVKSADNKTLRQVEHTCTITDGEKDPLIGFRSNSNERLLEVRQNNGNLGVVISPSVIENIDNEGIKETLKTASLGGSVILGCKNSKTPIKINTKENQFIVTIEGSDNIVKEYKCTVTPVGITFETGEGENKQVGTFKAEPINVQMSADFVKEALTGNGLISGLSVGSIQRQVAVPTLKSFMMREINKKGNNKIHKFNLIDAVDESNPSKNHTCEVLAYNPDGDADPDKAYYFITETVGNKKTKYVLHDGRPVEVNDVIVEVSQETGKPTIYLSHDKNGTEYQTYLDFGKITKNGPRMTKEEIGILQEITNFYGAHIPHEEDDNSINVSNTKNDFYIAKGSKRPANKLESLGGKNRTISVTVEEESKTNEQREGIAVTPLETQPVTQTEETAYTSADTHTDTSADTSADTPEQPAAPSHHTVPSQPTAPISSGSSRLVNPSFDPDKKRKELAKKLNPDYGVTAIVLAFLFMMACPLFLGGAGLLIGAGIGCLAVAGGAAWFLGVEKFVDNYVANLAQPYIEQVEQQQSQKEQFEENDTQLSQFAAQEHDLQTRKDELENKAPEDLTDDERQELEDISNQLDEIEARSDELLAKQNEIVQNMDQGTFDSVFLNGEQNELDAKASRYANGIVRHVMTRQYSPQINNQMLSHFGPEALHDIAEANKEYANAINDLADRRKDLDAILNQKGNYDLATELIKKVLKDEYGEKVTDDKVFKEILHLMTPAQSDGVVRAVNDFKGAPAGGGTPRKDLWNVIKGAVDKELGAVVDPDTHEPIDLTSMSYKEVKQLVARKIEKDVEHATPIVGEREAEYVVGLNGRRTRDERKTVDDDNNKKVKSLDKKADKQQTNLGKQQTKVEENQVGGAKEVAGRKKRDARIAKVQNKGTNKPRTQKQQREIEQTVARIEEQHKKKYQRRAAKAQKRLDKTQEQLNKNRQRRTDIFGKEEPTVTRNKVNERSRKLDNAVDATLATRAITPEVESPASEVAPAAEATHSEHTHDGHEAS